MAMPSPSVISTRKPRYGQRNEVLVMRISRPHIGGALTRLWLREARKRAPAFCWYRGRTVARRPPHLDLASSITNFVASPGYQLEVKTFIFSSLHPDTYNETITEFRPQPRPIHAAWTQSIKPPHPAARPSHPSRSITVPSQTHFLTLSRILSASGWPGSPFVSPRQEAGLKWILALRQRSLRSSRDSAQRSSHLWSSS